MKKLFIIVLAGISALVFWGCKPKVKMEIPVVNSIKESQKLGVDSVLQFDVKFVSSLSSSSCLISYHMSGFYTFRPLSSRLLTGVKVEELDGDGKTYAKLIKITPVLSRGGKSNNAVSSYEFDFVNEYIINIADPTKANNVKFICEDKEVILRLPPLDKVKK